MSGRSVRRYRLFEVVGLELEYVIVDRDLRPRCLLDEAFRAVNGRPTSDIEYRNVGFSNELAAHVFEIKTLAPLRSLARIEGDLVEGLRYFAGLLRDRFDARLLPTGMHPFMRPSETRLWQRAGRAIYETYANIFSLVDHGWLNVQASHVNLPFGSEPETVAMHNALACLLPYLPALAASSPIYEGRLGPSMDNRLEFYRHNQRRFPIITADIIPEFVTSYSDYRRRIFRPIRESLDGSPGAERLNAEWVNSRGAIMRFSRDALEIKLLDTQECIKADVAIAVFVRGALRHLVRRLQNGTLTLPEHSILVEDLNATIRDGSRAEVRAYHLRPRTGREQGTTAARSVLGTLLDLAVHEVSADEQPYLSIVEDRVRRGSLAERIVRQVNRRSERRGIEIADAVRSVYAELADCLEHNTPWNS
ncbi:MAG TPA: glutamate-cysteine ligase family protein [Gemmatimonadota bacterium]|nr:glutamate-cysteine ligase family protein [Gemmatimonadota bacterium]